MRRFLQYVDLVLIISLWSTLNLGHNAFAESKTPGEYIIKAAFLYNFAKFVDWPGEDFANDESPIILCILGKDPFGELLESIEGKTVKGRRLMIKRLEEIEDLERCHILFISKSEKKNLTQVFDKLAGWSVLTVSDMESFAQRGGIIGLVTEEKKIRFQINVEAAQHRRVKISSKLLKLAQIVENEGT
jgi:hypothetical protein